MSTPDDQAALRELAERLLAAGHGGAVGEGYTVELWPGTLPPDLPGALPLPPGSRVVGTAVHQRADPFGGMGPGGGQTRRTWQLAFDTPAPVAEVVAFYEQTLTGQGWTTAPEGPGLRPEGGFSTDFEALRRAHPPPPEVQAQMTAFERIRPEQRTFCPPAGTGGSLRLTATPAQNGPTQGLVHLDDHPFGPCGMQDAFEAGVAGRLPRLTPPPGVMLTPGGGGGSTDAWTSQASASTDQPPAALEAHFAAQLAAAGWVPRGGQASELFAWSAWAAPGAPPAAGFLSVREAAGQNRRECVALIEADDARSGGFGTSFVVGKSMLRMSNRPADAPPPAAPTEPQGDDHD
jgi:hypothetical protein